MSIKDLESLRSDIVPVLVTSLFMLLWILVILSARHPGRPTPRNPFKDKEKRIKRNYETNPTRKQNE
jgi:hypothetical protein